MPEPARNRITRFYGEFRAEHRAEADAQVVRELAAIVAKAV
jgi:hypothetical protein